MYFASESVGWVGTLEPDKLAGQVLATTDGGRHWVSQLSPPASVPTSIRFFDTRHGYVLEEPWGAPGSPPAVYTTADGGVTWSRIETPPNEYAGVYVDFADADHGWFATFAFGRVAARFKLYSTADAGVHWSQLLSVSPDLQESRGVQAGNVSGFWFTDARRGWLTASEPGHPVIYATEDGGQSWAGQDLVAPAGVAADAMVFLGRPVVRAEGAGVVAGFGDRRQVTVVYSTADGGRTWSPPRPMPASNPALVAMPDPSHVWGAIDSKLWTSDDLGATWRQLTALSEGYVFRQLVAVDSAHGWAGAIQAGPCPGRGPDICVSDKSRGKLLSSSDGGRHWSDVPLPA